MDNSIGENIRKIRIDKNLTQKELAEKSGISLSALNKYERGDRLPKIDALQKLSEALNIQIDYLLGKTEFKRFDSQIMLDDIKHLIEQTDDNDKDFSKLVRNIVDTMFLTVNGFADNKDMERLKIIHDLYRNIWEIEVTYKNKNFYNVLGIPELDENPTFEYFKEKHNILLDKLYKSICK